MLSAIWLVVVGFINQIPPNVQSCIQENIDATTLCLESQLGNTPFVVLDNNRYVSWSNSTFIKDHLQTTEVEIGQDLKVKYQINRPLAEAIVFVSYLWVCLLLGYKGLQWIRLRRFNLRQTSLFLFALTILFEVFAFFQPNSIAFVDFGKWGILSGLYVILNVFAIHYFQRIREIKKNSINIGIIAIIGLIVVHSIILFQHFSIGFQPQSPTPYLLISWLTRLVIASTQLVFLLLFISIIHSSQWKMSTRIIGYALIAITLGSATGVLMTTSAGIMIGTMTVILLLLLDMAIEEKKLNFLWMVIWVLAISLLITISWYVFSDPSKTYISALFNYFGLTFTGSMSLLVILLLLNSKLFPNISFAKLKLPKAYMLRHKVETMVLGTLVLSFVAIAGMTYLIEKSELNKETLGALHIIQVHHNISYHGFKDQIQIDSFVNGIQLISRQNEISFLPFDVYTHFGKETKDILAPPYLYRKGDDDLIQRFGPAKTNWIEWYNDSSLSKFLNIYVFLFILAIGVVYLFTNQLTRPLAILGQQLYNIDLGKQNKRIDWNNDDEIGHLIDQYNNMLDQLDHSAEVLARSERDQAWREMAKQVAHEIKNPLTPMKLTIQHLQMQANSETGEFGDKVKRVSNTLIEQIDNLTRIANNFSQFGQMPSASNNKILLNEVVTSVHDLFRKREDMDIKCFVPIDDLFVFADKDHMIRILNNIVKNAIQSIPHEQTGHITIKLTRDQHTAQISITDNGIGISDDQKAKVFQPNFTTKSSGTGLGLAMCAKMVDSMDGRIYFETEVGTGSTFFIEIPLMRIDANYLPEAEVEEDN